MFLVYIANIEKSLMYAMRKKLLVRDGSVDKWFAETDIEHDCVCARLIAMVILTFLLESYYFTTSECI